MGRSRTSSKRGKRGRGRGRPTLGPFSLPAPTIRRPPARAVRVLRGARRPSWKVVGLAGIAGVAATGVVVARNRRAQADLDPDELRERLRGRLAEIDGGSPGGSQGADGAGLSGAGPVARDTPA